MSRPFIPDTPQVMVHDHLMEHPEALLFVGMGVGKTAACLAALRQLIHECEVFSALVVAPVRVANLTWPMEVRDWDEFKWLKVANLRTPEGKHAFLNKKAHLYLINYESLHIVGNLMAKAKMEQPPYDLIIFDELTMAKNPQSKRINRFRRIPRPPRTWGLTGTPMPNSHLDLFAQVRLVDGGKRLGDKFMRYRDTYFKQADYMGYKWELMPGAGSTIEQRIEDITLVVHSKDWVDIPEPVIRDHEITLPDDVMRQYVEFERECILELETGDITAASAAALVTKLLQFTSGCAYDEFGAQHRVHDLKMGALVAISKKAGGPVLVAVHFKHEQDRIRRLFPDAEFFADAKTAPAQMALLNRWNAGKVPMLVAHPASVGHGLNLQHGGCRIVWFTMTYSRERYEQFICRLARRGQTKTVIVDRLIVKNTIDEVVAEALERKASDERSLLDAIVHLKKAISQHGG